MHSFITDTKEGNNPERKIIDSSYLQFFSEKSGLGLVLVDTLAGITEFYRSNWELMDVRFIIKYKTPENFVQKIYIECTDSPEAFEH